MTRDQTCKACDGRGLLADDEGWQYECSICHGDGSQDDNHKKEARILSVDNNNRLLD